MFILKLALFSYICGHFHEHSEAWLWIGSSDGIKFFLLMHLMRTLPLGFGSDVYLQSCSFGLLVRSDLMWSLKLRPTELSISVCCYCPRDEEIKLNSYYFKQNELHLPHSLEFFSLAPTSICPFPPYLSLINLVMVSWAITPLFNEMSCMRGFIVQWGAVSHISNLSSHYGGKCEWLQSRGDSSRYWAWITLPH